MTYDDILEWFKRNPEAKPNELSDEVAMFMRAACSGQIATPADFLANFYLLYLDRHKLPMPKTPEDYNMDFIDRASNFFDYVAARCYFDYMKREELVTYNDPGVVLFDSDIKKELKAEQTEKGKKLAEDFKKKIEEAYKEAVEKQKQTQTTVAVEKNKDEAKPE